MGQTPMKTIALICCGLCLIGLTACATPNDKATSEIILGMSAAQVLAILSDPVQRASRENYEAWRYEEVVRVKPCNYRNSGCRRACEHIMVWFYRNVVVSMTSRHKADLDQCGKSSNSVNWDLHPDYAFLCYRDRLELPATSVLCVG